PRSRRAPSSRPHPAPSPPPAHHAEKRECRQLDRAGRDRGAGGRASNRGHRGRGGARGGHRDHDVGHPRRPPLAWFAVSASVLRMAAAFRIGLIGLGHVGSAFAARLKQDAGRIAQAAGRPIVLESVAVARATGRTAPAPLEDAGALVRRPGLDAVVELMGGMEPAHTYLYEALQAGKQVITANKQVVASSGPDLARLGPLRFEAAVASAIPVVEVLAATLASDRIASVTGILNGTTNVILEAMAGGGSYAVALADVQPRLVPLADPLARVAGPANGIAIAAGYAGHLYLEGPGAGPDAAASAVLADVIRSAREVPAFGGLRLAALAGTPAVSIVPLGSASPY